MECSAKLANKIVNIELNNIPAVMENNKLNEFLSLFGKVNCISRSLTNESNAVVEFLDQGFNDPVILKNSQTSTLDSRLIKSFDDSKSLRNGQFLSDLLNILIGTKDENENVITSAHKPDVLYLKCFYCGQLSEFSCERCATPYCATKCQQLD